MIGILLESSRSEIIEKHNFKWLLNTSDTVNHGGVWGKSRKMSMPVLLLPEFSPFSRKSGFRAGYQRLTLRPSRESSFTRALADLSARGCCARS